MLFDMSSNNLSDNNDRRMIPGDDFSGKILSPEHNASADPLQIASLDMADLKVPAVEREVPNISRLEISKDFRKTEGSSVEPRGNQLSSKDIKGMNRRALFSCGFILAGAAMIKAGIGSMAGLPLAWFGINYAVVGQGYLFDTVKIFGKSESGQVAMWSKAFFLPYRMFALGIWHLAVACDKQDSINKVDDKLYIGRRLINEKVPKKVEVILDLTSEFEDRAQYKNDPRYRCFPILDGGKPQFYAFDKMLNEISDKCVFIHCAQGSGRTGLTALALLSKRNSELKFRKALKAVTKARGGVRVNSVQKKFLSDHYFSDKPEKG